MKVFIPLLIIVGLMTSCIQESANSQHIVLADSETQKQFNINLGWQYLEKKVPFMELVGINDDVWEPIDLPHTWNALDANDKNSGYRRSSSWYKKYLRIPKFDGAVHLYFEGVNMESTVYINGHKAGGHVGGYVGFEVDITDFVKPGKTNEILVWVDNSENLHIIPSQTSENVIFGGITRDVWAKFYPEVSLRTIHISTPDVSKKIATTKVQVQVNSKLQEEVPVKVVAALIDPAGNKRSSSSIKATVQPGISLLPIKLTDLEEPQLWSPDSPDLYSILVSLEADDIKDQMSERFGYRWYKFEEYGPFHLNGELLDLRGMHRYEERGDLGIVLPNSLHRKDMELLKEEGANFVRLAHHPHDPEVYRACDELGLLIWDEFPWCCGGVGSEDWQANTERLLKEQISQNFNNPSIILWAFGSELEWLQNAGDFEDVEKLRNYVSRLNDIAFEYDPYRPTSMRKFDEWVAGREVHQNKAFTKIGPGMVQR